LRKRGKLIQEMSESKSLRESWGKVEVRKRQRLNRQRVKLQYLTAVS
jgi:hypothetical protein